MLRLNFQRKGRAKRGLSTVVGTMFFIAVIFIAIGTFVVMFNAFTSYGNALKDLSSQQHRASETSLSIGGFSFNASASTVATSTTPTTTSISSERKVLFAQGLWWDFYSTGGTSNGMGFETSQDGINWNSFTQVATTKGSQYGSTFSIWQVSNSIFYVLSSPDSASSFYWRYGTLNSAGTITWSISQTTVSTTGVTNYYSSIAVDTSGNVWVAVNSIQGSSNDHIEVWEHVNGAGAGTWTKATDIPSLPSDVTPILVPLSSRGVALIYGTGGSTGQVYVLSSTLGWVGAVSPPSYYAMFDSSAVAVGNTVYFGGLASSTLGATSGSVNFWSFSVGQSATSGETILQSASNSWSVSVSAISTTVFVFYGAGSNIYYSSTQNLGSSFATAQTISSSESSLTGLNSAYAFGGLSWTSGAASPYNVRFSSLGVLTVINSSPFAVHVVSLYIYNPLTTALVHYDTNVSGVGVSGLFDYWIGAARSINVPLAFSWSPNQSYLVTVTTDAGLATSLSQSAPA